MESDYGAVDKHLIVERITILVITASMMSKVLTPKYNV